MGYTVPPLVPLRRDRPPLEPPPLVVFRHANPLLVPALLILALALVLAFLWGFTPARGQEPADTTDPVVAALGARGAVAGVVTTNEDGDLEVQFTIPSAGACQSDLGCSQVGNALCVKAGHGGAVAASLGERECRVQCELDQAEAFVLCKPQADGTWKLPTGIATGGVALALAILGVDNGSGEPPASPTEP